jgi:hypothetical protein
MSIEQLIVLIIFVVIPLIQALRRTREKQREPDFETEADPSHEPLAHWPPAAEPVFRPPPPEYQPPVVPPPARAVPREARPARRPAGPVARNPERPGHLAALRRLGLSPNDHQSLRRAMVLMAIFGRPRALDPHGN